MHCCIYELFIFVECRKHYLEWLDFLNLVVSSCSEIMVDMILLNYVLKQVSVAVIHMSLFNIVLHIHQLTFWSHCCSELWHYTSKDIVPQLQAMWSEHVRFVLIFVKFVFILVFFYDTQGNVWETTSMHVEMVLEFTFLLKVWWVWFLLHLNYWWGT